jgi:ribosomal protein S18 acetylase RimI-like enzyme
MTNNIRVELCPVEDWQRFKRIRLESLLKNRESFGTTYETASKWPELTWPDQVKNLPTFIASFNGDDIGVVRLGEDDKNKDHCWLISMWVDVRARGQGVGDLLIESLIDFAREQRYKKIFLDVGDFNSHAIKLYERNGFKFNGISSQMPSPQEQISESQMELILSE